MKITFIEVNEQNPNGPSVGERIFQREIVRVGRDPENCEIVFEQRVFPMVSRRHAEVREKNGRCLLVDTNSSFGTFLNGNRVTQPVEIILGSTIQFGSNGPILQVHGLELQSPLNIGSGGLNQAVSFEAPKPSSRPSLPLPITASDTTNALPSTLLGASLDLNDFTPAKNIAPHEPQLLLRKQFNGKNELTIGRGASNDIRLEGLQISKNHARLLKTTNGLVIEDANSTNGVYFAGKRITGRQPLTPQDVVQIGAFQLRIDQNGQVNIFDTRSKTRLDALHVTKTVKNNSGAGMIKLIDDVSLTIQPNEFVGLLGPSGAGKSTLMDAMNGMRPPTAGSIFLNNLDFYGNLNALKQSVGYVPQDDIIHRELSVYRTLYYIARLRLSGDASKAEIEQIIDEVLDVTGLTERRDVCVSDLSGGQRKRVSIAVELITKPSVIFLDEPTSGLDPASEDRIMKLFRRIAESGRTVILTTHAMENVRLFDKIVVLMRGKLVFYGTPNEALKHIGASSFKELYGKLEAPIDEQLAATSVRSHTELKRHGEQITEEVAESWKQKFLKTEQFRRNVYEPLSQLEKTQETTKRPHKRRLGIFGSVRQTVTLTKRYAAVLAKDKLNLMILLLQAPIIAIMTALILGAKQPRDFIYFVLSLVAVWFGTSVSAREIVRERPVCKRERMVNLGLLPYLMSKLIVLGFIVALQCLLLFVPLKLFSIVGLSPMPGIFGGLPQLFVMFLTASVGIALGLLISALVKTSEMATSLVPLILIPQILFSGLVGVPHGISKVASLTMPAAWSFDSMKRYSGLDTLEPEGSDPDGANGGDGLYKAIEERNQEKFDDYERDIRRHIADERQGIKTEKPTKPDIEKFSEMNLSQYVGFLNDWMRMGLNEFVLLLMFGGLLLLTLIVLRSQDIR
ncbi:MAG: FHA domain-containing protein [Pyrinomonadaceae bacterium]